MIDPSMLIAGAFAVGTCICAILSIAVDYLIAKAINTAITRRIRHVRKSR